MSINGNNEHFPLLSFFSIVTGFVGAIIAYYAIAFLERVLPPLQGLCIVITERGPITLAMLYCFIGTVTAIEMTKRRCHPSSISQEFLRSANICSFIPMILGVIGMSTGYSNSRLLFTEWPDDSWTLSDYMTWHSEIIIGEAHSMDILFLGALLTLLLLCQNIVLLQHNQKLAQ